jgi:hypothetical protein
MEAAVNLCDDLFSPSGHEEGEECLGELTDTNSGWKTDVFWPSMTVNGSGGVLTPLPSRLIRSCTQHTMVHRGPAIEVAVNLCDDLRAV